MASKWKQSEERDFKEVTVASNREGLNPEWFDKGRKGKARPLPAAVTTWQDVIKAVHALKPAELKSMVYTLALQKGLDITQIMNWCGIFDSIERQTFANTYEQMALMGRAHLAAEIFADQIELALTTKQMLPKIWVGKQFAGQLDEPAPVIEAHKSEATFVVNVITKDSTITSNEDGTSTIELVDEELSKVVH